MNLLSWKQDTLSAILACRQNLLTPLCSMKGRFRNNSNRAVASISAGRFDMQRNISPPRSRKRIRLDDSSEATTCSATSSLDAITIYSWNVNGISPFLQPSVASYFTSTTEQNSNRGAAKASLRDFLRRHGWPTVLFLQEVKINPDDSATTRAVKKAVRRQTNEPIDAYDYEARTYFVQY